MKKRSFSSRGVVISVLAIAFLFGAGLAGFSQARGDVNSSGTIDITDALMVARYAAGLTVTNFNVNAADANCDGVVAITDALVIARYSTGLGTICSSGPTATKTPTPTPTGTTPPAPTHLDNAFSGTIKWYVNEDWAKNARANGGTAIANCNTVVWMDRIEAINPPADRGMGLVQHLDACLAQGANLFTLMIYDLPGRDCSASASNGELECDASGTGMSRYKSEFVDPIVNILKDPKYYGIRIVTLLETDSLPNLVTNVDKFQKCQDVNSRGCYVQGVQYCLNQLAPLKNVYTYLEIAHSAWLGWPDNFDKAISLYANTIRNTTRGTVDGFCTNVCNTLPLDEPFITNGDASVGGTQIKQSRFYEWNPMVDEFQYADAWYSRMSSQFPGIGMLVDTARNGWGGPNRPRSASTSTDVNIFVDQSRIDRRYHRGNWCNNKYAGLGERPRVAPRSGYEAFIWVKPPGESDGVSQAGVIDPQDPNKKFDNMCDPSGQNTYCNCGSTDARANMPHAGRFSVELFQQLLTNAYPAM